MSAYKDHIVSSIAFISLSAVFLSLLGVYFFNIVLWRHYPDLGFWFRASTGFRVVGGVTDVGEGAGLRLGDRIERINGQPYESLKKARGLINRKTGAGNTYQIQRNGQVLTIRIENEPIGFAAAFGKSGFTLALGVIFFGIGFLVFLMKPHGRAAWIFFTACTIFGTYIMLSSTITQMKPAWLDYVTIFAEVFIPAALIHLAMCFPVERELVRHNQYLQYIPYLISTLLFSGIILDTDNIAEISPPWLVVDMVYRVVGFLVFLGSCFHLWLTSSSEIARLRSKLILIGSAIAISVPLLDFVANVVWQQYILPSMTYALPFYIVFPSFIGYAIVKHDLFDIDTIIKRTYGYVLTTGSIAGAYGLVVLISNVVFGEFAVVQSPLFPLFFVLTVAIFFNPLRSKMQAFVDRTFYRLEYDYQETVKQISESMRSLIGLDDVMKTMMQFALEPMFIDSGCIMLRDKSRAAYECLLLTGEPEQRPSDRMPSEANAENRMEGSRENEQAAKTPGMEAAPEYPLNPSSPVIIIDESDPMIAAMVERKKEITVYDVMEDPVFEGNREAGLKAFDKLKATLMVPLIYEDHLTGILALGRKKSGKFYRKEDINLLNTLANQGAIAIENARMIQQVIEKERMDEELSIAHNLQMRMLPEKCPELEGIDITAYSKPAREVGGDFYDFLMTADGNAGIVVGDVTGKSVSGALVMSASRSIFRMLAEDNLSVREMMIRANRRSKEDTQKGMFVALLYAQLNPIDRTIILCSAGQTQPILRCAQTNKALLVETIGDTFPLGIFEEADYQETHLQLHTGDCLVLYTDGIVEAQNKKGEILGFDQLIRIVEESKEENADQLLNAIIEKVDEFVGDAPQHDDITIIVLRIP